MTTMTDQARLERIRRLQERRATRSPADAVATGEPERGGRPATPRPSSPRRSGRRRAAAARILSGGLAVSATFGLMAAMAVAERAPGDAATVETPAVVPMALATTEATAPPPAPRKVIRIVVRRQAAAGSAPAPATPSVRRSAPAAAAPAPARAAQPVPAPQPAARSRGSR
ncbi:MAG: hypothetical protein M5U14_00135 [Acidimicrobiia bacterium]|nr:hypothetical protein [Acidimicrobiia bacterium]